MLCFVMADGLSTTGGIVDVDAEIRVKYNGVRELRTSDAVFFFKPCATFKTPCFADADAAWHEFCIDVFKARQFATEKFDDLECLAATVDFRMR